MTHRNPNHLLMVMPYHQLVRKAVQAGFKVWSVWDPELRDEAYLSQVADHSEQLLLVDFEDESALRSLIARTAREQGIGHVLHLGSEASMGPVLAEAEALGLSPNSAESVRLLNDKAAMRRLLNRNSLSVVRVQEAATVREVAGVVAQFGYPAIVKPARSAGSRGVRLVRHVADLEAWAADAGHRGPYIVEEFLEGPQFSVETLSAYGMHQVVGITAKQTGGPSGFVETGHVFPAPLGEQDAAAVRATVRGLLDLAGYEFGPAHTEVILTARGPRIVESQARLGGDRIPLLVEAATGFDPEAGIFRALAGGPVEIPAPYRYAAIGFFQLPHGRLESVSGVAELRALPYVHSVHFPYRAGDFLPRTTDSATRHGYAVIDAATPEEAAERVSSARRTLQATTTVTGALR